MESKFDIRHDKRSQHAALDKTGMYFSIKVAPSHRDLFLGPTRVKIPNGISMVDRFSRFLHRSQQTVAILYSGPPLSDLKVTPSHERSGPHLTHDSLGPSEPTIQTVFRSVQPFFARMTAECPYTLQWNSSPPSKLPLPMGGYGPPYNALFPGPTQVLNPNVISIGSAVFAGLTSVTDQQTD